MADRLSDLGAFYEIVSELRKLCSVVRLGDAHGRMSWPERGVYFFFEDGEDRSDSGSGPRVVRVGTHALKAGSRTTLGRRLRQHRGVERSGGGNHRASIFRLLVGAALIEEEDGLECPTWGLRSSAQRDFRAAELPLERAVSDHIRAMTVLCVPVDDASGPESRRGYLERNAIALLSDYSRDPLDPPSTRWLGLSCPRERVQRSGLWNNRHVDEPCNPDFLSELARLARDGPAPG